MSPDEIESKVKEIICNQLEVSPEQLRPDASFIDDLKADSLAVVSSCSRSSKSSRSRSPRKIPSRSRPSRTRRTTSSRTRSDQSPLPSAVVRARKRARDHASCRHHRYRARHADRQRSGSHVVRVARRQERRGAHDLVRHHQLRHELLVRGQRLGAEQVVRQARAQAPRSLPAVRRRRGHDGRRRRGLRHQGAGRPRASLGQLHRRGPRRRSDHRRHQDVGEREGAASRLLGLLRHRHHHQRAAGHDLDSHRRDWPELLARLGVQRRVRTRSARRSARSATATPTA